MGNGFDRTRRWHERVTDTNLAPFPKIKSRDDLPLSGPQVLVALADSGIKFIAASGEL